jgi:hypothetical protein
MLSIEKCAIPPHAFMVYGKSLGNATKYADSIVFGSAAVPRRDPKQEKHRLAFCF